jgi:hypothetical protein
VRGEAYLMFHDGNRAAAEFQKFIDRRGVVMNFPWGALAHHGLQRYEPGLTSTKAHIEPVFAHSPFQGVRLTLWPGIPL